MSIFKKMGGGMAKGGIGFSGGSSNIGGNYVSYYYTWCLPGLSCLDNGSALVKLLSVISIPLL